MNNNEETIKSEGLLTTIWGPDLWNSLHNITFNYPKMDADSTTQQNYKNFFESLQYVLPCSVCRDHYTTHINGEHALTSNELKNRSTITRWLYDLHCAVNDSTGVNYNISYEDLCNKHESYIADCDFTLEQRAIAYKNYYNKEPQFLKYKYAKCFDKYAKKRGITDFIDCLNKTKDLQKTDKKWIKRNELCNDIIKKMRIGAIPCLEQTGEFEGLPTIMELNLMMLMSTTMSEKIIKHVIKKLGYKMVPKYNFAKCG